MTIIVRTVSPARVGASVCNMAMVHHHQKGEMKGEETPPVASPIHMAAGCCSTLEECGPFGPKPRRNILV